MLTSWKNDLRRHSAYGVDHLKHYLRAESVNRDRVLTWVSRGEAMMAADLQRDTPLREAFILALGDTIEEGNRLGHIFTRGDLESLALPKVEPIDDTASRFGSLPSEDAAMAGLPADSRDKTDG